MFKLNAKKDLEAVAKRLEIGHISTENPDSVHSDRGSWIMNCQLPGSGPHAQRQMAHETLPIHNSYGHFHVALGQTAVCC